MNNVILTIIAIFLPPLAAALRVGLSKHFWINVVLTIIGWLPGVIHALWLIYGRTARTPAYH